MDEQRDRQRAFRRIVIMAADVLVVPEEEINEETIVPGSNQRVFVEALRNKGFAVDIPLGKENRDMAAGKLADCCS